MRVCGQDFWDGRQPDDPRFIPSDRFDIQALDQYVTLEEFEDRLCEGPGSAWLKAQLWSSRRTAWCEFALPDQGPLSAGWPKGWPKKYRSPPTVSDLVHERYEISRVTHRLMERAWSNRAVMYEYRDAYFACPASGSSS